MILSSKQFFLVEAHNRKSALYKLDSSLRSDSDFVININDYSDHLSLRPQSSVEKFFQQTEQYYKSSIINSNLPEIIKRAQYYILRKYFDKITSHLIENGIDLGNSFGVKDLENSHINFSNFEEILNKFAPQFEDSASAHADIAKGNIEVDPFNPVRKIKIKSLFKLSLETEVRRIYLIQE